MNKCTPPAWVGLALALAALTAPHVALAQGHVADSSIAPSLLVAATTLPSAGLHATDDSVFARRFTRGEVQYSRTSTADMRSMLVIGARSDQVALDTLGWNASVFGVRAGFARGGAGDGKTRLSALEAYFGGRTMGHLEGARANVGAEIVAGWSRTDSIGRGSLAFRFPVEFIRGRGQSSVAFSVVPAIAWGQLRFRSCEDRGPGDNCGSLGVQLAAGRTRFVLGSAVTLSSRAGLSLTAGAQHLFPRTQQPRFALALSVGG